MEASSSSSNLPSCRVQLCDIWGSRLSAESFRDGDPPLSFPSLWPDASTFVSQYRDGHMDVALADMVKLLLASGSYLQMEELIKHGIISWDYMLEQDNLTYTLIHLVCALNCKPLLESMVKQIPKNGILSVKDSEGRTPVDVCFSPDCRKAIKKHVSRLPKMVKTGLSLTSDIKRDMFNAADSQTGLYQLAIMLQTYKVDVNVEKNEDGDHLLHTAVAGDLPCLPNVFLLATQFSANVDLLNQKPLKTPLNLVQRKYEPNKDESKKEVAECQVSPTSLVCYKEELNLAECQITPLSLACYKGELNLAEVLVCVFGAAVNGVSNNGWTALHYSAYGEHPELVSMLLSRGADASCEDNESCTPSHIAELVEASKCVETLEKHVKERTEKLAQLALEGSLSDFISSDLFNVTEDGCTLLMKAVLGNQPTIVQALVKNAKCPINFKQVKKTNSIDDQPQQTATSLAAANGFDKCLQILIDAGADSTIKDSKGLLPLHHACMSGSYQCVKIILDQPLHKGLTGLKKARSLLDASEADKDTCIIKLVEKAQQKRQQMVLNKLFDSLPGEDISAGKLVQFLEDGDDVNCLNEAYDWPILFAAGFGQLEIIETLHKLGGHVVRSHTFTKNTPLHTAARGGHLEVVRYLLTNFCIPASKNIGVVDVNSSQEFLDINAKNSRGETPLELAAHQGHLEAVRLLLDHGALTTLPDSQNQLLYCKPGPFLGINFLISNNRRQQVESLTEALVKRRSLEDFKKLWQGPSCFNLRDDEMNTVLMLAACHSKLEIMEFLLQSATHYTSAMKISWNACPDEMFDSVQQLQDTYTGLGYVDEIQRPVSVDPIRMRQDDDSASCSASDDEEKTDVKAPATEKGTCVQSGIVCLSNNNGYTALHCAVEANKHKMIPLLLRADPLVANKVNKYGKTALHLGCKMNFSKCVKSLLNFADVDSNIRDNGDNLAEDFCISSKLKKKIKKHRMQQIKNTVSHGSPTPHFSLVPVPTHIPQPSDQSHNQMAYNVRHPKRGPLFDDLDKVGSDPGLRSQLLRHRHRTRACADRVRNPTPQVASLSLPQGQGQHSLTLNPGSASDHFDNVYRAHLEKDD